MADGKAVDYYAVLGVGATDTAGTIRKAYRKLALKHHPDKDKSPNAGERFKLINEAYSILSDDDSRRAYDRRGRSPRLSSSNVDLDNDPFFDFHNSFTDSSAFDVFNDFFGTHSVPRGGQYQHQQQYQHGRQHRQNRQQHQQQHQQHHHQQQQQHHHQQQQHQQQQQQYQQQQQQYQQQQQGFDPFGGMMGGSLFNNGGGGFMDPFGTGFGFGGGMGMGMMGMGGFGHMGGFPDMHNQLHQAAMQGGGNGGSGSGFASYSSSSSSFSSSGSGGGGDPKRVVGRSESVRSKMVNGQRRTVKVVRLTHADGTVTESSDENRELDGGGLLSSSSSSVGFDRNGGGGLSYQQQQQRIK